MKLIETSRRTAWCPVEREEFGMIRSLVGYATFALLAMFAIKVAFKLLGLAVGLFWTLMWLAFGGVVCYLDRESAG